jgi:hypothetical protein
MIGQCHCQTVTVTLPAAPPFLYDCNCSLCQKSGGLWGYFTLADVSITGATSTYRREDKVTTNGALQFCAGCGSTIGWLSDVSVDDAIAVINMRLFDPAELTDIALEFPDGAGWTGQGPFGFRAPATTHKGASH